MTFAATFPPSTDRSDGAAPGPAPLSASLGKLPQITLVFWIMKICATTLGETAGDLLSMTLKVGYFASTLILLAVFFATLAAQLMSKKYHPVLYWAVILSTSTAGTTMSDFMDRSLGLGYAKGSAILAGLLLAIFVVWKLTGSSFSVEKIRTRKVEILYWTAILISNTLGTALGDYLADDSGLGFEGGAGLIGFLLAALAILAFTTRISHVFLFWMAFVLTRPFGANIGDVLTKSPDNGGLGYGTIGASAILFGVLLAFIIYTSSKLRHPGGQRDPSAGL